MSSSNAMENDKKRLRNQFTKDERIRLLGIMTEYGPLLDDKNISILSRKEIWEIIENKFNEGGHSGRTSAQLKKYWQNYKYHNKRTKIIQKTDNPKPMSPTTKQVIRMMAKVDPEEWGQYNVIGNLVPPKISPKTPKTPTTPVVPYELCAPLLSKTLESVMPVTPINIGEGEEPDQDSPPMLMILTTPPRKNSTSKVTPTPRDDSGTASATSSSETGSEIKESNVVVSTTDVSGSSVTVSVICPEVPPKSKAILWKKKPTPDNMNEKLLPGDAERDKTTAQKSNHREDRYDDLVATSEASKEMTSLEKLCRKISEQKQDALESVQQKIFDTPTTSAISNGGHSIFIDNGHRLVGMLSKNRIGKSPTEKWKAQCENCPDSVECGQNRCFLLPHQKDDSQFMDVSKNHPDSSRNVIGIVRKIPGASTSKNCDAMEVVGMKSHSNEESDNNVGSFQGVARSSINNVGTIGTNGRLTNDKVTDRNNNELNKFLLRFAALEGVKRKGVLKEVEQMMKPFTVEKENLKGDWLETLTAPMDNNQRMELIRYLNLRDRILAADPMRKDLMTMKCLLKPLLNVKEFERKKYMASICRFVPTLSNDVTGKENDGNEKSSSHQSFVDNEQRMDVDVASQNGNGNGNGNGEKIVPRLKIRNISSMSPDNNKENVHPEIKLEREDTDTDAILSTSNLCPDNGAMVNFMVQARMQRAKAELEHQLELQKLEMDERRLKVKIAEMTVHETRLRIQSLNEERLHAKELYELRLAQITAEKVRAETEYMVRMDASQTVADEGRARISNVERDRERSESLYQMQLRCMGINSTNIFNANSIQYR